MSQPHTPSNTLHYSANLMGPVSSACALAPFSPLSLDPIASWTNWLRSKLPSVGRMKLKIRWRERKRKNREREKGNAGFV